MPSPYELRTRWLEWREQMATPEELKTMLACVERELAFRRACYPRWVKNGKMKQEKADHEIHTMEMVRDLIMRIVPPF